MCIKDSVGYKGQRNDVVVNYLVIGGIYGNTLLLIHVYLSTFRYAENQGDTYIEDSSQSLFPPWQVANAYISLDVLVCSIAEYRYVMSTQVEPKYKQRV